MSKLSILFLIFLSGCIGRIEPTDYKCTADQMDLVNRDTKACSEHGGYMDAYCYRLAMDRYCEKKERG